MCGCLCSHFSSIRFVCIESVLYVSSVLNCTRICVYIVSRCLTVCLLHRYIRVAVLPCSESTCCLFRTRGSLPQDIVEVNEVFGVQMAHNALRQKTLRVDICHTSLSGREECLVSVTTVTGLSLMSQFSINITNSPHPDSANTCTWCIC